MRNVAALYKLRGACSQYALYMTSSALCFCGAGVCCFPCFRRQAFGSGRSYRLLRERKERVAWYVSTGMSFGSRCTYVHDSVRWPGGLHLGCRLTLTVRLKFC